MERYRIRLAGDSAPVRAPGKCPTQKGAAAWCVARFEPEQPFVVELLQDGRPVDDWLFDPRGEVITS